MKELVYSKGGVDLYRLNALTDNYIFVLISRGKAIATDPSEADPVLSLIDDKKAQLTDIWTTHHHWDHVGGNLELKFKTGCEITSALKDKERVPGVDKGVTEGDSLVIPGATFDVIDIPGHTSHHIALYSKELGVVFTGDTLFSLGCGKLFEGTAPQMFESLKKLKSLPDETLVCCGHEYTLNNLAFSLEVDPENEALHSRAKELRDQHSRSGGTVPFVLGHEKKTNPFLRAASVSAFAEIRKRKDSWTGPRNRS